MWGDSDSIVAPGFTFDLKEFASFLSDATPLATLFLIKLSCASLEKPGLSFKITSTSAFALLINFCCSGDIGILSGNPNLFNPTPGTLSDSCFASSFGFGLSTTLSQSGTSGLLVPL